MGKLIDLTGMVFDRLTVIRRVENRITPKGYSSVMWECECECGNKIITYGRNLRKKETKSCGCLHQEIINNFGKTLKKYNKYNLSGDYGIGYTSNTNEEFYFDLEDYDKIKDYCWYVSGLGQIYSNNIKPKKPILLNRLIMNFPKDMDVHYMNHNIFDNRKKNLQIVTHKITTYGRSMSSSNTSGAIGVSFNKRKNKWEAYISINQKKIHLGYFFKKSDAIKARKIAEEKYFGEYSYDNRMKGDENNE